MKNNLRQFGWAGGLIAVLGIILAVSLTGSEYFTARGFPLDDAWIHAVYGRSLANSGLLAYNPGDPSAGATSVLWAAIWAVPHVLFDSVQSISIFIKGTGLFLHLATGALLFGFAGQTRNADPVIYTSIFAGAAVVAAQPDLLAASISGMEIPIATAATAGFMWASYRENLIAMGAMAAVVALARPEASTACVLFPLLMYYERFDILRDQLMASISGLGAGCLFMGTLNYAAWGHWLPATFYAKASGASHLVAGKRLGDLWNVTSHFTLIEWNVLIPFTALWSLKILYTRKRSYRRLAASVFGVGIALLGTATVLTNVQDPSAFYFQRYFLLSIPFVLFPLPIAAVYMVRSFAASTLIWWALGAAMAVAVWLTASDLGPRLDELANDAHNIDDIQVQIGKSLADASPKETVWATDAGAIRYFGNAYVVDLMGLNSPRMLMKHPMQLLLHRSPDYIEVNPGWLFLDDNSADTLPATKFKATTEWTVTKSEKSGKQYLVKCNPPGHTGKLRLLNGKAYPFRCARNVE